MAGRGGERVSAWRRIERRSSAGRVTAGVGQGTSRLPREGGQEPPKIDVEFCLCDGRVRGRGREGDGGDSSLRAVGGVVRETELGSGHAASSCLVCYRQPFSLAVVLLCCKPQPDLLGGIDA